MAGRLTGGRAYICPPGFGRAGPASPEALGRRIDESLAAHGDYLARAHGPFQRLSNWGAIQAHGLFLIGLWLGRADWQALALGRLEENLRHAILPDGVQWEQSPMYHCEVLHALLDTLLLAERNGIAVPPLLPEKARAMCQALAVWAAPDRTILPQGDSDVIDAGDLLAAGALLFRDPLLAAAAQGPLCEETLWDFGPDAPARLAALPAAWPDCPSQKLEASGNYILRSGWGREDTWIHFRAGSLGGGLCQAELVPVSTGAGQPLPPGTAGAVRIRRDGAESTVLFSWQAGSHDADLLCAGDCTGHGNVLVFTPQCPQGLCLD